MIVEQVLSCMAKFQLESAHPAFDNLYSSPNSIPDSTFFQMQTPKAESEGSRVHTMQPIQELQILILGCGFRVKFFQPCPCGHLESKPEDVNFSFSLSFTHICISHTHTHTPKNCKNMRVNVLVCF